MDNTVKFIKVLFSATITSYLLKSVQFLITLITLPIIISQLGKVQYGIYILVGQTIGFLALSDIGVRNSMGRFISKFNATNNSKGISTLISTSFYILLAVAVFILFITIITYHWIPIWLNIDAEYYKITRIIYLINGFFLALLFPIRIGQGILAGFQKYSVLNLIGLITVIIQFSGILFLYYLKMLSLLSFTLMLSLSVLFSQIVALFLANRYNKIFPLRISYFSKKMAIRILNLGLSSFLITLSGLLVGQAYTIGIGIILGTASAGIYGVVIMIITNISFILTKMGQPLVTIASELDAQKDKRSLRKLTNLVMNISFTISSLFSIILIFNIHPLLHILMKSNWDLIDYRFASISIIIMSVSISIGIPQFISRAVLQGVGLHWKASFGKIIASTIAFVVGISLMLSGLNIIGAAIGWGVSWILQAIFYFPKIVSNYLEQTILQLFKNSYLPGVFISTLNILIGYVIFTQLHVSQGFKIVISISVLSMSTFILFLITNYIFTQQFEIPTKYIPVFLRNRLL